MKHFVAALGLLAFGLDGAAATASGRNWQVSIERIECTAAQGQLTLGARIRYLGPKGPVEAPLVQLADSAGRRLSPRSLVWKSGDKALAQWLSAGGVTLLQGQNVGAVELNFDLRETAGDLRFEFGDIAAFALTQKRQATCGGILKPGQLQAPRPPRIAGAKPGSRVHRGFYPCLEPAGTQRRIEAAHPPYLPRQLVLLGRGYLPNAREIDLPMGKVPAQSYAYYGADDLNAIEAAALRAIPLQEKQFAFNWGTQKTQSGNEADAIGLYELRPCPR